MQYLAAVFWPWKVLLHLAVTAEGMHPGAAGVSPSLCRGTLNSASWFGSRSVSSLDVATDPGLGPGTDLLDPAEEVTPRSALPPGTDAQRLNGACGHDFYRHAASCSSSLRLYPCGQQIAAVTGNLS